MGYRFRCRCRNGNPHYHPYSCNSDRRMGGHGCVLQAGRLRQRRFHGIDSHYAVCERAGTDSVSGIRLIEFDIRRVGIGHYRAHAKQEMLSLYRRPLQHFHFRSNLLSPVQPVELSQSRPIQLLFRAVGNLPITFSMSCRGRA